MKNSWPRRWLSGWIPWFACSGLIVQGAVLSPKDIPTVFSGINDVAVHVAEYFVLFLLSSWTFYNSGTGRLHKHYRGFAFCYGLFLGAVTELLQYAAPERSPLWSDYFSNIGGTLLGFAGVVLIVRNKTGTRKTEA